jgi:hypothetical protein
MKNRILIYIMWKIWEFIHYVSSILWDLYGDEFIDLHCQEETTKFFTKNNDTFEDDNESLLSIEFGGLAETQDDINQ